MEESIKIQSRVKMQCENLKNDLVSMKNWEQEMREKEKNFKNSQNHQSAEPPVRSHLSKMEDYEKMAQLKTSEIENKTNELKGEADKLKEQGNAAVKSQKWQEAMQFYTKAIELYDKEPAYYSNRSLCYFKLNNHPACIRDCSSAIKLDDKYQKAYFRRMQSQEALGELILAFKDIEKVIELSSESEKSKFHNDYNRLYNSIMEEKKKREKEQIKWSRLNKSAKITNFVDKPAHLRSKKPLKTIPVQQKQVPEKIPEAIIDKIFNNNTGENYLEPETDSKLFKKNFLLKSKSVDEKLSQKCPDVPQQTSKDDSIINTKKSDISGDNTQVESKKLEKAPPKSEEITKVIPKSTPTVQLDLQADVGEEKKGESPEKTVSPLKCSMHQDEISSLMENLENLEIDLPGIPKTGPQFYSVWKELTELKKFLYLKNLALSKLAIGRMLGPLLDSELLSEILMILKKYFVPQKLAFGKMLLELGKNREMTILSFFLTKDDKNALQELINHLKESGNMQASDIDLICSNFLI